MFKLRPFNFNDADYEAMSAIQSASYSDNRMTASDHKRIDNYTPQDEYDWARTMAEVDGQVVGYGLYTKTPWLATPNLYLIGWVTHPDFRNHGIASAYWQHLQTEVLPQRTVSGLLANCRSDVPAGPSFLAKRGFVEQARDIKSYLDLATWRYEDYATYTQAIVARGIVFKPLSALLESDANCVEKLLPLEFMVREDEPHAEPPAPISAETFHNYYMSSDSYYPEGWFIALDGDKYVGWCAVFPNLSDDTQMQNGITVIDRDYRRIGLATAMKAHALRHAQQLGKLRLNTSNAATNPMLEINRHMGFQPLYDQFEYKKSM